MGPVNLRRNIRSSTTKLHKIAYNIKKAKIRLFCLIFFKTQGLVK